MSSSHYSSRSAVPISLLYVEDDVINQEVLRTMLTNVPDVQLHIASDDTEAFEQLAALSTVPDVVLMDHHLGHVTGVEVMECMRARYGDVFRFVLCTALSDAEARELTKGSRAMTFITKPYSAAEIVEVVRATAAKPAPSTGAILRRGASGRPTRSRGHSNASSHSSKHLGRPPTSSAPRTSSIRVRTDVVLPSGSNRRRPSGNSSATDTSPSHHSGGPPQLGQHASDWLQHLSTDVAGAPSQGSSSNVTYPTCSSAPGGHQSAPVQSIRPKVRPPEGASVSAATADEWARQEAKAMSDEQYSVAPPSALSSGVSQGDSDSRAMQHRALLRMRTGPVNAPNMAMVQPFHSGEGGAAPTQPDAQGSPSFASASFSALETAAVEAAAAAMAAAEPARRARSGTNSAHRSLTEVILHPDSSAHHSGMSNDLRRPGDASGGGDTRRHSRRRGAGESGHTNKLRERAKDGGRVQHREGKRHHDGSRSRKRNFLRTDGGAAPDWTAQFVQALDGSNVHTIVSPDPNLHVQPPSSSGSPASFMGPRSTLQMLKQAHARNGGVVGTASGATSSGAAAAAAASGSGGKNAPPAESAAVAVPPESQASLHFPDGASKFDSVSKAQLRKWFGSDPGDIRPGRTSYERLRDVLNALTDGSTTGVAVAPESAPRSTTHSSGLQLTDDGSPHAQTLTDLMRIHGRVDCGEQAVWGQRGKAAGAAASPSAAKPSELPAARAPLPQPIPEDGGALPSIDVKQVPRLPQQQQASVAPGNSEYSSELSFKQQVALKHFSHSNKTRSRSSHQVSSHASRAAPPSGTDSDLPGTNVSSLPELHAASFRSADAREDLSGPRFSRAVRFCTPLPVHNAGSTLSGCHRLLTHRRMGGRKVQEVRSMVREINEATRVLSLPAARAQPPDVNISVWDLFTVLGFGEAAHLFTKSGITVADLSTMPAMRIMEHGLVVISQLDTLMYALSNL